jgi:hypothetical protein
MEQTKQTFAYKRKINFSDFYGAIAFAALTVFSWYSHSGIRIRRLKLLDYPASVYVWGGLTLVCLAYALWKLSKARQSKDNPHLIEVGESSFSFPHKNGKAEVAVSEIESTERHSNDDDNSFSVWAKGKHYEFSEENFENEAKYAAFVELIEKLRKA